MSCANFQANVFVDLQCKLCRDEYPGGTKDRRWRTYEVHIHPPVAAAHFYICLVGNSRTSRCRKIQGYRPVARLEHSVRGDIVPHERLRLGLPWQLGVDDVGT